MVVTANDLLRLVEDAAADDLVDVIAAAARLGVTAEALRAWAARGLIPHRRVGQELVFTVRDLALWQARGIARLVRDVRPPDRLTESTADTRARCDRRADAAMYRRGRDERLRGGGG